MNANLTRALFASLRGRQDGNGSDQGCSMTISKLLQINKENGSPSNPLAVTKLELSCQVFSQIDACISAFGDCAWLSLNRNKIQSICNLDGLVHLRCLYLQHNQLSRIEGLHTLTALRILDVSNNAIRRIEGLQCCLALETLLAAGNHLTDKESVEQLLCASSLAELDLGHNDIRDPSVLDVFSAMASLQTLTLHFNPLSNVADPKNKEPPLLPNYRRTMISRCKHLTALDHRPVFHQERAYAEAWWGSRLLIEPPTPSSCSDDLDGRRGPWEDATSPASAGPACMLSDLAAVSHGDVSGGSGSEGAASADAFGISHGVLEPVLSYLSAKTLVQAALVCRGWAYLASWSLREVRLKAARARLALAEPALLPAMMALEACKYDELQELHSFPRPSRPLFQLHWALKLLWDHRRGSAPGDIQPLIHQEQQEEGVPGMEMEGSTVQLAVQLEGEELQQQQQEEELELTAVAPSLALGSMASAYEAGCTSGLQAETPLPEIESVQGSSRRFEGKGLSSCVLPEDTGCREVTGAVVSAPQSSAALFRQEAVVGEAGSEAQKEELLLHFDCAMWTGRCWGQCLEMVRDPAFPSGLSQALPLLGDVLLRLRARLGTADDLEVYTPLLHKGDVARCHGHSGKLAEWLLAIEEREYAAHLVALAVAWEWPEKLRNGFV